MAPSPAALPPAELPLVFVADLAAPELHPDDHHHLQRVLRVAEGAAVTVSDGAGGWRRCRFGPSPALDGDVVVVPPPSPELTVAFALVKGERPELVVQKLTELGVDRIVPFAAARSVVRWDAARAERHVARFQRVAREASMQARRCRLPVVEDVTSFDDVVCRPGASGADRGGAPLGLAHPVVLIGPEGGWDDGERARLPHVVGLGDQVLRAETAAITAGALLAALRTGVVGAVGRASG